MIRVQFIGLVLLLCSLVLGCGSGTPPPLSPQIRVYGGTSEQERSDQPAVPGQRSFTVVLDPGHNGANAAHSDLINQPIPNGRGGAKTCNTTGTSTNDEYSEHAFNWDVAIRVRDELERKGIRVVLTRQDDSGVGPCANERAMIANAVGGDALISIHADGASPDSQGFHIIYSDPPLRTNKGEESVGLAKILAEAFSEQGFVPANYVGQGGLDGRSDLAGLNFAEVPAVVIECGNMRNGLEARNFVTAEGRAQYAEVISTGILGWLSKG